MRIIMMGTGPFAVPTFHSLLDCDHEVVALVTKPTAPPRGRQKAPVNPTRDVAEQRRVQVLSPANVNDEDARKQLANMQADLLVVCDYGRILKNETLEVARLGGINLHASLLPKYRGAAPINWAIYQGEATTGVTVIHMSPKLDAGPCLVQLETEIDPDESADALEKRIAQLGVEPVRRSIEMLSVWDGESEIGVAQDSELATKAPRLKKSDGEVDWSRAAEQIRNQVRAMKPWPGTYTFWHSGQSAPIRVILDWVSVVQHHVESANCGQVVSAEHDRLWIATGDGALAIDKIQPAGKRVMTIGEFLRGHPVKTGDRFGGIASDLDG